MSRRNRVLVVADRARRLYWRLVGPRTIGVRTIVRDEEGRVLLVRHSYGSADWHLPGGGVRRRETVAAAARRETLEETGIAVPGDDALRLHGVFSNLREGKSDHVVVFEVRRWERDHAATDPEIAETGWFAVDALPERTSPGTRRRVGELVSGTSPGFGW